MSAMSNEHIKFIALDLDGTILDKNYNLSPRVVNALYACRQAGKRVIISTGRVLASARKPLGSLETVDGFVCSNGADVYDGAGKLLSETHMDDALSSRIVDFARSRKSHFHAFKGDDWYYEIERPYTAFYFKRSGLEGRKCDFDNMHPLGFTKCLFLDDHEVLEIIRRDLETEFGSIIQILYSAPFMLELMVSGVTKASGLKTCVERFGGSLEQTIAFGDAENDEDMLMAAGMGVAMGNAPDSLKAKCDAVAPSVDDEGVAVFLEKFFA
jgi:Cof subfamily protein (haloacid dehalogenase superfamily)